MHKADVIFEGGGVCGIAHSGALLEAQESFGYEGQNLAGGLHPLQQAFLEKLPSSAVAALTTTRRGKAS